MCVQLIKGNRCIAHNVQTFPRKVSENSGQSMIVVYLTVTRLREMLRLREPRLKAASFHVEDSARGIYVCLHSVSFRRLCQTLSLSSQEPFMATKEGEEVICKFTRFIRLVCDYVASSLFTFYGERIVLF